MPKIPKSVKMDKWLWDKLEEIAWEKKVTRNRLIEAVLRNYAVKEGTQKEDTQKDKNKIGQRDKADFPRL